MLNCELPHYPIDTDCVEKISSELTLYKLEKEFYCAAFFVIGQQEDGLRNHSKICAPLFLYPAKFVGEGGFFLSRLILPRELLTSIFSIP